MHKPVWPRGKALGWYTDVLGWYTDVYNDVLGWCTDVLDWYTEVLGWYIDVLSWYTDGVGLISKFGSLFFFKSCGLWSSSHDSAFHN